MIISIVCSGCNLQYPKEAVTPISDPKGGSIKIYHFQCLNCKLCQVVSLDETGEHKGVSVSPTMMINLTDAGADEFKRFSTRLGVNSDDVLDLHKFLKKNEKMIL